MTHFSRKKAFDKAFETLNADDQQLVLETLNEIEKYYQIRQASHGLRVKKLHESIHGLVYEARASIHLRILWVEQPEQVTFVLIGSHDTVSKYLKNL